MGGRLRRWMLVAGGLGLLGCASLDRPVTHDAERAECETLFERVDAAVEAAGVRDEGAARVAGFPWLRSTRLLASFRDEVEDEPRFTAWLHLLGEEDAAARRYELRNLGASVDGKGGESLNAALDRCRERLVVGDRADPALRDRLREAVAVPDDYVTARRVLGLYPVTASFVSTGIRRWHREAHATFALPREGLPVAGTLRRWEAPSRGAALSAEAIAAILEKSPDALGIPRPEEEALASLFTTFAPRWEVDVVDENDLPGAPDGGRVWRVDTGRPTVYWLTSHTRLGEAVLLQLNYVIWFAARPGGDMYAGLLDGIQWRVTLDTDGEPLLYDAIHPCGCYHMFFPSERLRLRDGLPRFHYERPLVPQAAPQGRSLTVRVSSGDHYIQRVYHDEAAAVSAEPMDWAPYDSLRALPGDGGSRNLFGSHGLVEGTERPERFLFWPMGVRSAGAMRQWGRQPTAFVGRRHFDDPDLVESIFQRTESGPARGLAE